MCIIVLLISPFFLFSWPLALFIHACIKKSLKSENTTFALLRYVVYICLASFIYIYELCRYINFVGMVLSGFFSRQINESFDEKFRVSLSDEKNSLETFTLPQFL